MRLRQQPKMKPRQDVSDSDKGGRTAGRDDRIVNPF